MQTIQEVIRNLDRKCLEGRYFYEHSPKLWEFRPDDTRTIEEVKNMMSEDFQAFLDRLCNMQVKQPEGGKVRILYAHKEIWDTAWCGDIATDLVYADEVLNAADLSEVEHYAYEFTPQEEALGYFVADTKLTQDHLYDVVVSFLYEVSFFGYEQEDREEKLLLFEKDWINEIGIPKDEKSTEEEKLDHEVLESISKYNKYCKKIELEKVAAAFSRLQS